MRWTALALLIAIALYPAAALALAEPGESGGKRAFTHGPMESPGAAQAVRLEPPELATWDLERPPNSQLGRDPRDERTAAQLDPGSACCPMALRLRTCVLLH
ncbi:MAG: hypothetical protein AAF725_09865 [Acidobacteriota bacterium]